MPTPLLSPVAPSSALLHLSLPLPTFPLPCAFSPPFLSQGPLGGEPVPWLQQHRLPLGARRTVPALPTSAPAALSRGGSSGRSTPLCSPLCTRCPSLVCARSALPSSGAEAPDPAVTGSVYTRHKAQERVKTAGAPLARGLLHGPEGRIQRLPK